MSHTKEKCQYYRAYTYGNGHPILQRGQSGCNWIQGLTPEQAEADARRLAAAWNAVQDIPTEALEDGVVDDMLKLAEVMTTINRTGILAAPLNSLSTKRELVKTITAKLNKEG